MSKLRWTPYIMFDDNSICDFWKEHFKNGSHKLLFIMGKGFDVRMNISLSKLLKECPNINIECILIDFDEGSSSSSHNYQSFVEENMKEFNRLMTDKKFRIEKLNIWKKTGKSKRVVGDRKAAEIIKNYSDIKDYTDIIIDISSLPRGIYFSLIGKILTLIDSSGNKDQNLFVSVAENVDIDSCIQESAIEDDLTYLHGFGGEIELESEKEKPLIWFPILGENKSSHISRGADKITEDKNRLYEICPVLPFPSKDPRRSDTIIIEYHELLFDSLDIEPQNIMYTTERNPFEAYIELSKAIKNYRESLDILNGCKAAISTFSSKLLSIGTLLAAYENQDFVGILNVNSGGYNITDEKEFLKLKNESELFVTWLTGNPYKI
ncbi:hypothetical protein [Psychroserpens algicola]|uniref:Uncharacterized protein n=1 Tax=Psychroserpens algicola TaxID=1719034 RepID=A0ABT0HBV4_9FLAO|nr:hypothetical protein [Psychroserpens algicola]MCK8481843.1 hypothetical protein [Psychroserpens algicola]